MNKQKWSRLGLSIGVLAAVSLGASWLLDVRVAELAELVRSRQGLAGIGEVAAQDVHRTLLIAKNVCFGMGLVVGVAGGIIIGTIAASRTGTRRIEAGQYQEFYQERSRVNQDEFR